MSTLDAQFTTTIDESSNDALIAALLKLLPDQTKAQLITALTKRHKPCKPGQDYLAGICFQSPLAQPVIDSMYKLKI